MRTGYAMAPQPTLPPPAPLGGKEPKTNLLELRGLTKAFGATTVLQGIDLDVRRGEFLTFLGPSGCGKTTTLRIIGGFETPDSGDVLIDGRSVAGLPPYRRPVHTVFQHYALFPHYDIFENVAFALRIQRLGEDEISRRVREALAIVKLPGFERRRVDQLSGGQQQRIALARALVGQPKLLLLDEPLGALDLKLRKEMQLELKRIQRGLGITFIYVTHDQEEAMTMSDRIAVFNRGRIEQLAGPKELYGRPATSFVADFIGSANLLKARLVRHPAPGAAELLIEGELKAVVPCGAARWPEGAELTVMVRPERLRLKPAEAATADPEKTLAFPAILRESVFLGASHQFFVEPFRSGPSLVAVMVEAPEGLAAGRVRVEADLDDVLILDAGRTPAAEPALKN